MGERKPVARKEIKSAKNKERELKSAKIKAQKRARKDYDGSAKVQVRRPLKRACPALPINKQQLITLSRTAQ
jgi:hypothetical protein